MPQEMVEPAEAQVDIFAERLEDRGVRVDRPAPIDFSQRLQTPDWVQETMAGCMPPRDLLFTVGNVILEATMSLRNRWFEYLAYVLSCNGTSRRIPTSVDGQPRNRP